MWYVYIIILENIYNKMESNHNKKARVVLLSPNIIGSKDGVNRIQPGHGVGLLAGRLRDKGHEIYVRDTALEGYYNQSPRDGETMLIGESEEDIIKYVKDIKPEFVGISILFSNLADHGRKLARIVKEIDSSIITILGGNHVNHMYMDIIKDPYVDYVLRGECDFTLEILIDFLKNNKEINRIPGLVAKRRDNSIYVGEGKGKVEDLNTLPKEARELMNMEKYFEIGLFHSAKSRSKRVGNIMATRGCPENCVFCTTPKMWGNVVRWRSPESVYQEIKELKEVYGVEEIQFDDDTLTANRKNLLDLCDLIEPLQLKWCTPNGIRVNYPPDLDKKKQMFKRMNESGCYQVTFAVESGDQDLLDNFIRKNLRLEVVKPTVVAAKEAGMFVHVFFMVGFPGETREQMEKTIRFAEYIESDSYSVAIACPLPGAPMYDIVKERDLFVDDFSQKRITFRKSLIKVDGFKDPREFEKWVGEQNIYLNNLLKQRDKARFIKKYGTTDDRMLKKQT